VKNANKVEWAKLKADKEKYAKYCERRKKWAKKWRETHREQHNEWYWNNKQHCKERYKQYYQKHKEHIIQKRKEWIMKHSNYNSLYVAKKRKILILQKGNKCEKCGYNNHVEILEFHHSNPKEKEYQYDYMRKDFDLSKVTLLCPTCHKEQHLEMFIRHENDS